MAGVPATTGVPKKVLNEKTPTLSAPPSWGDFGQGGAAGPSATSVAADPSASLPPAPVHSPQLNEECTVRGKGAHNRQPPCLTSTAAHDIRVHDKSMVLEGSPLHCDPEVHHP